MSTKLILASSSPYRKSLLERLQIPFEVLLPAVDETPRPNENPRALVLRLSEKKAKAISVFPSLVIGCDQVGSDGQVILGKPISHENAVQQLLTHAGKTLIFYSGICLYNTATRHIQRTVVRTKVTLKKYSLEQILVYLKKENPLQCAGAIKAEGLGIALLESIQSNDPTALLGLPLIALTQFLAKEGIHVL